MPSADPSTTNPASLQPGTPHVPAPPGPPPPVDPARMEALVQLAGGIAPALSDLLTVIRGQAGLLLDAADHDPGTRQPLSQIYTAAEKAGSLLRQLLIFSGHQTGQAEAMDLNAFINETSGVLRQLVGAGIAVDLELATHLPLLLADPNMIEEYLIILAQNARDAMPAGGRLLFKTEAVETTTVAAREGLERRPGIFVGLSVEDSGCGIAPGIRSRLFEPFFTTKAGGRSTGLGLATAHGIVRQHHGWIEVTSVVNGGSSFKAFLPAAPAGLAVLPGRGSAAQPRRGNETILLVEDDAAVREMIAGVLKDQGYRVLQATSGPDALEVWRWHAARVRLLLTDLVLEDRMTGLELAARLRAENSNLKVICTSGHRREDMRRFPELAGGYRFVQKPCRPQTLMAAVRALLDEEQL